MKIKTGPLQCRIQGEAQPARNVRKVRLRQPYIRWDVLALGFGRLYLTPAVGVHEEEGNKMARWECLRKRERRWCDSSRLNVRWDVLALGFCRLYAGRGSD
jgi:hypothetical protein